MSVSRKHQYVFIENVISRRMYGPPEPHQEYLLSAKVCNYCFLKEKSDRLFVQLLVGQMATVM